MNQRCVICDVRPRHNGESYCAPCGGKIAAEVQRSQAKPFRYIVYRGNVVGLYPKGRGELSGRWLKRGPKGLPKGRTINLDQYCPGYTRDMVKRFKAMVLSLSSVGRLQVVKVND